MIEKMIFRINATAWPLTLSLLFGMSCARHADIVRPGAVNVGQSLGDEIKCTPELLQNPNGAQRFIVEWNDGDREALENEMADGVAVVKYTCDGIEVLRSCAVPGEYGYRAGSRKSKSLQITDAASAAASLSTPVPGAAFRAAMEQGKALNLAYVMVGSMTTPVKEVSRAQIDRAACREGTHFVYQTQVGAFAIESGEHGKALLAVDVLRYGSVDGDVSSGRQSLSYDGDAESCEASTSSDTEPPEGCNGMMRLSIIPLVDEPAVPVVEKSKDEPQAAPASVAYTAVDTRSCPPGMVFESELCVKESKAQAFLCERGDYAGCEKQCKKGSQASCDRMAEAFLVQHQVTDYFVRDNRGRETLEALQGLEPVLPLLKQACEDEEQVSACTLAALTIGAQAGYAYRRINANQGRQMLELFTVGCERGNEVACEFIMDTLGARQSIVAGVDPHIGKMESTVAKGCDSGATESCLNLGSWFVKQRLEASDIVDFNRGAKYLAKACWGGNSTACFWAATIYGTNDADVCESLVNATASANHKDVKAFFHPHLPSLTGKSRAGNVRDFCKNAVSVYSPRRAQALADKSCFIPRAGSSIALNANACLLSKELKRVVAEQPAPGAKADYEFVSLPGGEFTMGCLAKDTLCQDDEKPARKVVVAPFALGRYPVTVAQYQKCVDDKNACSGMPGTVDWGHQVGTMSNGKHDHPLNFVDWAEAKRMCEWLGARLPTSEEWEWAAKGGENRIYPWGDAPVTGTRANYCDANCAEAAEPSVMESMKDHIKVDASQNDGYAATSPVGSFPAGASKHGILDMAGNVKTWTTTQYDAEHYEVRGGAWHDTAQSLRASRREKNHPSWESFGVGVRCAVDL